MDASNTSLDKLGNVFDPFGGEGRKPDYERNGTLFYGSDGYRAYPKGKYEQGRSENKFNFY